MSLLRRCTVACITGVLAEQLISHYKIDQTAFSNLSAACAHLCANANHRSSNGSLWAPLLLSISALCCALGHLCLCNPYYYVAFFGRLLIGFGSSFAFVGIMKLATMVLPANRFALVSGSTMALGMIGGLIGDQVLKAF